METMWIVETITEKPGQIVAELKPVEWFKPNPEFAAVADVVPSEDFEYPDEFIDALPGEEGAEYVDLGKHIELDITNGPELHPLDNVRLSIDVLVSVE